MQPGPHLAVELCLLRQRRRYSDEVDEPSVVRPRVVSQIQLGSPVTRRIKSSLGRKMQFSKANDNLDLT